ncbi:M23 family metallopeptidase [Flavobacterium artemisiae]|uniref:M23 family metallopeptidase n=2 Tax=Flavobacterium artemisiae TaxID=2126556 RepID=A0ABW4HFP7_9FLAO
MKKNTIHNFNISIQNSADIESSEQLTQTMIKELAKVSKEIHQQKDIEQLWQEQNAGLNLSTSVTEEGAKDIKVAMFEKRAMSEGNTSLVSGKNIFGDIWSSSDTSISNAPNGGGAADTTDRITINSVSSAGNTSPFSRAEESLQNVSSTGQVYGFTGQQSLSVPQMFQTNTNDPSIAIIKAEIKKKLDFAKANNTGEIDYWERISKAFDNGAVAADFDGKPEEKLFTHMYADLKKSMLSSIEIQNFNWEDVRVKMIKAIDDNILTESIFPLNKERWEAIKKLLLNENINVANLFEQYDELFLLLKEVEGLESLPNTLTITTKTKIYPNLSVDKMYPNIGKEALYVFLKQINETNFDGRGVNKGAVKIKNVRTSSFIVGESLDFFVDEAFISKGQNQKENINWIVYNVGTEEENIFKNEGVSFSYNFDKEGTYRIDAYGKDYTVKQKQSAATATYIELKIIAQQIIITSSAVTQEGITRVSAKDKFFKVALKNSKVKTLNPLKLYYKVENKTANKVTVISEEKELDSAGIIKFSIPSLGEYCIKVRSKDQYALKFDYKINAVKNEVASIGQIGKALNKNVFLLGLSNNNLSLETKTFKINPATDEEKEDVKWIIYDANHKPYFQPGSPMLMDDHNPKKMYLHKWTYFDVPFPHKKGEYTIEAYSDTRQGSKAKAVFNLEMKNAQIAEAFWASKNGSKKTKSGFAGESNWITAHIPYYENQLVRVYFYLRNKKTDYYIDVNTNENGDIFKEIKFDSSFRELIGLEDDGNAKIGFRLLGIQNGKPYKFISPVNYESDTVISTTTDKDVVEIYFRYDGKRLRSEDQVPFGKEGAMVAIVAKTQNMVGDEVTLKVHKANEEPVYISKVRVNSDGVAAASFLMRNLDKKLKLGEVVKYYAGVEEYSTIKLKDKVLVMIVGEGKNKDIVDENDPLLIWGGKVSKEFRVKVYKICKELWPDNSLEMANGLMAVMNRETGETFAPHQIEGKKLIPKEKLTIDSFNSVDSKGKRSSRAVGLIQFTQKPLTDMGEYKGGGFDELHKLKLQYANMTQLEQLEKVKKYMKTVAKLPTKPEDIYLAVFAPAFLGNDLNDTMYKLGTEEYDKNASLDVDIKKNGIQLKELIVKYYESFNDGEYGRNIWHNPLDNMELRGWYRSGWDINESNYLLETNKRSKGKHLGLDLYSPVDKPVYACVDGIALILYPEYSSTFGLNVRIEGYYNQKKYNFFYAHLNKIVVKNLEKVKAGTLIGYTGQTGEAEGQPSKFNHLHFEVRSSRAGRGAALNPMEEISNLKDAVNTNPIKENQK